MAFGYQPIWDLKISNLKMMDQCHECTNEGRIKETGADDEVAGSAINIKNHSCIRGNISCLAAALKPLNYYHICASPKL
jgi:hypothetical protein